MLSRLLSAVDFQDLLEGFDFDFDFDFESESESYLSGLWFDPATHQNVLQARVVRVLRPSLRVPALQGLQIVIGSCFPRCPNMPAGYRLAARQLS